MLGTFSASGTSMTNVTLLTFTHQTSPSTVAVLQTDDSPGRVNRRGKFKAQLIITHVGAVNSLAAYLGDTLFYRLKCVAQD
ncbi:MAG TPA: hypothetical protein DCS07_13675 [Bdellovibrionales bacterium]|nr:MAG: hypothetical protein A2X97_16665 [Bdellovibrionales bacterium GWA1_52_35]OFZ43082.1 MAG: hypothetical protein A2070_01615 [Bdellovibrionales bacterium GWC1_52_8]HAR43658.1 hypothetical protein [Bdellovibrionales bacterium]HCM38980.1 hypothetical protein [Bdellovibrionales bacterium]